MDTWRPMHDVGKSMVLQGLFVGLSVGIGGLLIPLGLSLWRLASGTTREWWIALLAGAIGVAVGFLVSWFVLRGAALAGRRARLSVTQPLAELWRTVGNCGSPPKDQSRRFAVIAISLTLGV